MRRPARVLLAATSLLSLAAPSPLHAQPPRETYTVTCTFSNPGYSGPCSVSETTPRSLSPDAACKQVLACLNDVRCATKTYCNATAVRGGWKLVSATEAPDARPR